MHDPALCSNGSHSPAFTLLIAVVQFFSVDIPMIPDSGDVVAVWRVCQISSAMGQKQFWQDREDSVR